MRSAARRDIMAALRNPGRNVTAMTRHPRRRFLPWLASGLGVLVLAWAVGWYGRYHLIEPEELYRTCLAEARPWWCAVRQQLIGATFAVRGIYGWVSLGAAAAGWLLEGRIVVPCVLIALGAGGLGLELYSTGTAALGVLLALLRLSRLDEILAQPPKFYP